jgi:glycerophosphoryl diester phosphodiesterase
VNVSPWEGSADLLPLVMAKIVRICPGVQPQRVEHRTDHVIATLTFHMALPPFYAHRFGRTYGPDSAATTLRRALAEPLSGAETDCCLTADGALVLVHDPLLQHGLSLQGWAHESHSRDILSARILNSSGTETNEQPLLLAELFELLPEFEFTLQLEAKAFCDSALAVRTARSICAEIEVAELPEATRVEVISFWPQAVAVAAQRGLHTRLIVACPYTPEALRDWAIANDIHGIILEAYYWDPFHVTMWREAGLSVMSGVCNDPELLRRLLPLAPDAVASDRPHELKREVMDGGYPG